MHKAYLNHFLFLEYTNSYSTICTYMILISISLASDCVIHKVKYYTKEKSTCVILENYLFPPQRFSTFSEIQLENNQITSNLFSVNLI